jgi:CRP-like cAMP-binding protein
VIAQAHAVVTRSPLLSGLSPDEVAELVGLTSPWSAEAGELLYRQGDPADRLLVVTAGLLEASVRLPTGETRELAEVGAGALVGELALLARGPRMSTLRAIEPSEGVALSAEAFEFLRSQTRPAALAAVRAIGETALGRLQRVYELLLDDLDGGRLAALPVADGHLSEIDLIPDESLRQLLFFERFADGETGELTRGLRVLAGPRGAALPSTETLWIVLRGAVETALERDGARRRVRLAGPGRCVGHMSLLDGGTPDLPLRSVLRERAVLLEVPRDVGRELIAGDRHWQRRFAEALYDDVVRAVLAAETPQAPVVRHAWER